MFEGKYSPFTSPGMLERASELVPIRKEAAFKPPPDSVNEFRLEKFQN